MAKEISTESKLYVKEEIDKVRKEFNEELKAAQSKSMKIFSTVAMIVGLLTALGVYYPAKSSINNAIDKALEGTTIKNLEEEATVSHDNIKKYEDDAINLNAKIVGYEKDANDILSKLGRFEQDPNGYARFGEIMFSWGSIQYTGFLPKYFHSFKYPFDKNCLVVIPDEPGYVLHKDRERFMFEPTVNVTKIKANIGEKKQMSYLAIGY